MTLTGRVHKSGMGAREAVRYVLTAFRRAFLVSFRLMPVLAFGGSENGGGRDRLGAIGDECAACDWTAEVAHSGAGRAGIPRTR